MLCLEALLFYLFIHRVNTGVPHSSIWFPYWETLCETRRFFLEPHKLKRTQKEPLCTSHWEHWYHRVQNLYYLLPKKRLAPPLTCISQPSQCYQWVPSSFPAATQLSVAHAVCGVTQRVKRWEREGNALDLEKRGQLFPVGGPNPMWPRDPH